MRGRKPLRILHIYPKSDYFTGAAVQLLELATGLADRGHRVVVATRPSTVWAAKTRERGLAHCAWSMGSAVDLGSLRALIRLLRAERMQIVHAHKGKARTMALLASLFTAVPVLVVNRGVSFKLGRLQAWGYATRRVTAVVAVCESIQRGLVTAGVPAEKIEVIYSGTDIERFHPSVDGRSFRKELGLDPGDLLITQVGVRSTKGNDDLIDALAIVVRQAPHVRLLIVGARDARALYQRARVRGVEHALHVLGYREDIPEILRASQCCVDASHTGPGVTGTLREALAVETPVVATAIEGNSELVQSGVTGLLVRPRDAPSLAEAILRLVFDRQGAAAMGQAGRQLVASQFSTRIKVERMETLYRRLLDA